MHDTVLLTPAQGEEARALQKAIEDDSTDSVAARPLRSAFLIMRQYQSKAAPQEVAAQLLMSLGMPYTSCLKIDAAGTWDPLELATCKDHVSQWLTEGLSSEPPVFAHNESQADAFLEGLFNWTGTPTACFQNSRSLFKSRSAVDRGAVLVETRRVALLWFMGWDDAEG